MSQNHSENKDIEELIEYVDWRKIIKKRKLTERFITKYIDQFSLNDILKYQILSEEFIEMLYTRFMRERTNTFSGFPMEHVIGYQTVSESFIEKHLDEIRYEHDVARYQTLSEEFMEKHMDKLNWSQIAQYQELSIPFMEKHIVKLGMYNLSEYQNLPMYFYRRYSLGT